MNRPTINARRMLGWIALAAMLLLSPPAMAEVHLSIGHRGHHGHHGYNGYHRYHHRYGGHGFHHGSHGSRGFHGFFGHRPHHKSHAFHGFRGHHRSHGFHRPHHRLHRPHGFHPGLSHHDRRHGLSPRGIHREPTRIVVLPRSTHAERAVRAERAGSRDPVGSEAPYLADRERPSIEHTAESAQVGWRWFEDGRYDRALRAFGAAAVARPRQGEPKLGYALASAMRGDDDRAAYAMRRVLRFEPGVLDRPAPVPEPVLQKLIERYEYRDSDDGRLMLRTLKRLQQAHADASPDVGSGAGDDGDQIGAEADTEADAPSPAGRTHSFTMHGEAEHEQ